MWLDGIPHDPGADSQDRFVAVRAITLHRTIGRWRGDYGVGKGRRHDSPGTFNFLVGQGEGEWVQFYRADCRCSHAAGANYAGPGIEISGMNDERLTPWQVRAVGELVTKLSKLYGLPRSLRDDVPRLWLDQSDYRGSINHLGVDYPPNTSFRHFDFITQAEFAGGTAPGPVEPSPPKQHRRSKHMIFVINDGEKDEAYQYVGGPTSQRTSYIRLFGAAEQWVNHDKGSPIVRVNRAEFQAFVAGQDLASVGARGWTF